MLPRGGRGQQGQPGTSLAARYTTSTSFERKSRDAVLPGHDGLVEPVCAGVSHQEVRVHLLGGKGPYGRGEKDVNSTCWNLDERGPPVICCQRTQSLQPSSSWVATGEDGWGGEGLEKGLCKAGFHCC